MAKQPNQKKKLIIIARYLYEQTDETHGVSIKDIISELEKNGISAERKALYDDIEALNELGFDIVKTGNREDTKYHLMSRDFELVEIKLLVDSVQASKFISEKKARTLIKKLSQLTSKYQAGELNRQVHLAGSNRAKNEQLYYCIDTIYDAINSNCRIGFTYNQWTINKTLQPRRNGKAYETSPIALIWDDEYYYLLGYDSEESMLKHYRVDKMSGVKKLNIPREGLQYFKEDDLKAYDKRIFNMYGGEVMNVTLEADDDMASVLLDRFGTDIKLVPSSEGRFKTNIEVALSAQFVAWIFAFTPKITITGPDDAVVFAKKMADSVKRQYK